MCGAYYAYDSNAPMHRHGHIHVLMHGHINVNVLYGVQCIDCTLKCLSIALSIPIQVIMKNIKYIKLL